MIYQEEQIDLFSVSPNIHLVQCISADLKMGAGIAVQFNKHFDVRNTLINKYKEAPLRMWDKGTHGFCILEGRVFNLVTKRNYWHKPTYESLRSALTAMRNSAISRDIKEIAMPLIGCGLDGLSWEKVSELIREIFYDTDIEILVCNPTKGNSQTPTMR